MRKFSGSEVTQIINMRAEAEGFRVWGRDSSLWGAFLESIWLHTTWSSWFKSGVFHGAGIMIDILDSENKNTAEYQCLLHHFRLDNELKVTNEARN